MAFGIPRRLLSVWHTAARRETLDRELDEELRASIDVLADRYESAGMTAPAARRAAIAALGGPGGFVEVRENVREARVGAGLDTLLVDLRQAWRGFRSASGFMAVVGATLALGVGANTAIFGVVHGILLQPLPYRDADRLAVIWLDHGPAGYPRAPLSGPDLGDLRHATTTFEQLGAIWASGTVALSGDGDPEQLRAALVTTNFFDVLGTPSALGRTFRTDDSAPGAPPTVLIGWDLFQRRFGGDPSVVGRQILVDDQPTTVIGVMPQAFRLLLPLDASVPDHLQVWAPFWPDLEHGPRGNLFLRVVGRMRPGVTVAEASAEIDGIARSIPPDLGAARAFQTIALQADDVREVRAPLLVLFTGVAILLTIGCVNVASLLIARAASRARETAVRIALGASRWRLLRQSLLEGLLLTIVGAAGGLVSGYVGLQLLLVLAPPSLSRAGTFELDVTVVAFTLAISAIWGALLSLAPALELFRGGDASRRRLTVGALSVFGARSSAAPVRYRARATLVAMQIALSVVLLIGAGLLVRAFIEVHRVDPGFRAESRLTFRVAFPESRYREDRLQSAADELQRHLSVVPGVTGVGAISHLPFDDLPNWGLTYGRDPLSDAGGAAKADARAISAGLFETIGVRLIEGRFFNASENPANPVVIVDEKLASQMWPGQSALGRQFLVGQAFPERRVTVVGVVAHLRLRSLVEDLTPQIFIPFRVWQRNPLAFVVRTGGDPAAVTTAISAAVARFDPQLPIYDVREMSTYLDDARAVRRFTMVVTAVFALSAVVLTCIGVYGVLAYAVASRRHEFGVRRALGASRGRVIRQILGEGLGFAVIGCAAGLMCALLTARLIQTQLYAIEPRDPVTYGVALAIVLTGATLACLVPACRAIAVSPMDALRSDC